MPYRCKGRFYTTCSCGETEEWSRLMCEDVVQVNHRHVVFTVNEGLWGGKAIAVAFEIVSIPLHTFNGTRFQQRLEPHTHFPPNAPTYG
nr:transposase zinc-binding domain-containing protein [Paenibacillus piri]